MNGDGDARGVVIAIGGDLLLYLVDEPDVHGALNVFLAEGCSDCTIIGHVYNVLAEVARIEVAANAASVSWKKKNVDPPAGPR